MSESRVYLEDPFDLETFLEALHIARSNGQELRFLDLSMNILRLDPCIAVTDLAFIALEKLDLIDMKTSINIL